MDRTAQPSGQGFRSASSFLCGGTGSSAGMLPWPCSKVLRRSRHPRGILDTSVVIDLESLDPTRLPLEVADSAITMGELAAGPHATTDADERARRQDRLQRAEAAFDPLPFDLDAARSYGRIYSAVVATGRKARGPRAVDLMIAATALSLGLPLYTRNIDDLDGLEKLLDVVEI